MDTEILSLSSRDFEEDALIPAAEAIRRGGLVVFPTETVYGLGADATDPEAVAAIFRAKGRPQDNPLIIHIAAPEDAEKYTYTSELYYKIAEAFMPGPITVIMRSRDVIPPETRAGLETVAVRCPEHSVARALIRLSGCPIAAPSANISGSPSPTCVKHVIEDMKGRCEFIIDGGDCDFGLESTIVKIDDDGALTLLRPGKITVSDLSLLGVPLRVAHAVTDRLADGEVALSPGMKYRHYAPRAEVILLDGEAKCAIAYVSGYDAERKAVIAYTEDVSEFREKIAGAAIYDFGARADLEAQAHSLFAILRAADKENFDVIFAPLPSEEGIGLALYNRMIRAAAHKIIRL